jgi:predicted dehydrogenase
MNVGIIGAGLQGKRRLQAILLSKENHILAVADTNIEAAKSLVINTEARAYSRWEEVISRDDLDVIVICTPPNRHAQIGISAMKNGKHILCEKPLAMNTEEATEMLRVALNNHVKIKSGFNHRHHLNLKQAKTWVSQNQIGDLINIRALYGIGGRPGYEKEWRANPLVAGGGQLMDQGMHLLDLCRWFLGDFNEVIGYLDTSFWNIAPVEDNAFALLHTKEGRIACIHTSWTQWKNTFRFEITGKDGYIIVDGLGGSYGTEKIICGKRAFLEPFREEIIEYRGEDHSWLDEWQEFETAIRENHEPLGNGNDGLQALKLSEAIYTAFKNRNAVKISD